MIKFKKYVLSKPILRDVTLHRFVGSLDFGLVPQFCFIFIF